MIKASRSTKRKVDRNVRTSFKIRQIRLPFVFFLFLSSSYHNLEINFKSIDFVIGIQNLDHGVVYADVSNELPIAAPQIKLMFF